MHSYIYARLEQMQAEKVASNVTPSFVTKKELLDAVNKDARNVLNQMYLNGIIKIHPTKDAPIQDYVELVKE